MTEPSVNEAAADHRLMVLMFTDLVDSSGLKRKLGDLQYAEKIARPHNDIFRAILATFSGAKEVNYTGDGFFATFSTVDSAVEMALLFHQALHAHRWPEGELQTRIGIHVGGVVVLDDGSDKTLIASHAADMCARLMSLAQGRQTLLTRHAFDDARQFVRVHPPLPGGQTVPALIWMAHGRYRFKGAGDDPFEVFEVGAVGFAPAKAPTDSEKARRVLDADEEETLGWRPAAEIEVPGKAGWLVQEKLGEGGFGEVWLVRNQKTRERRVFKFCFDPDRLRSFKRELTIFRLIRESLGDREDIARLHDVRLDKPPFFLESDFVPSGNLAQWAERKGGIEKISLAARLDLMTRICRAVAAAHSVGVIHKDIKPSNVLMHEDAHGQVTPVLADFGIGIVTDAAQFDKLNVTRAGFTMSLATGNDSSRTGTRLYAPPESMLGKAPTVQTDVFALGVTLYQLGVGDLERPLATGWERDVANPVLREDIAAATRGRLDERLHTVNELLKRLEDLPKRQAIARRNRVLKSSAIAAGALAVVAAMLVLGVRAFRNEKINQLTAAIGSRTETLDLSDAKIAETDRLIANLARFSSSNAAEHRRRVTEQLAAIVRRAIDRANLSDGDRLQIEHGIALVQPRDAAKAAELQRSLEERVSQWEPAYSLEPPFDKGLPEGATADGGEIRLANHQVALPVSLTGNTRVVAEFGGMRDLKSALAISMRYEGGSAYDFRVLPAHPAPRPIALDVLAPDFADRMRGWSAYPIDVGSVVLENGQPILRVERRADDPDTVYVEKQFDTAPHRAKVWNISFRARVTGMPAGTRGSARFNLFSPDKNGKNAGGAFNEFKVNCDWTAKSIRLVVPAGALVIRVQFGFKSATGRFDIADLRIVEKDASAPADAAGDLVLSQPQKEWLPAKYPAHRWMPGCDERNVSVMTENGQTFLRLVNNDENTKHTVFGQIPIDSSLVKEAKLTARIRMPLDVVAGPNNWNRPRVRVTLHGAAGKYLKDAAQSFSSKADWIAVSAKLPVSPETESVEVGIDLDKCKGAIDVSELTCSFAALGAPAKSAQESEQPTVFILRNQVILREQAVPISWINGESLRLTAERAGSFLRLQIGNQRPLEVFDPLPLPPREHRALLNAGGDIRIRSLSAYRQTLPAKPLPLELGDELYAGGKFSEALTFYEKQAATSADPETRGQAQYKAALCLLQLKQTAEAEKQLAEAARTEARPWGVLASCQLLAFYLDQKKLEDADAVFQYLRSRRDFSEIGSSVSAQIEEAITNNYIDRYRSSLEFGTPADWQTGIEKLSQVLGVADVLGIPPNQQLTLDWHINRFYEATRQIDQATERARTRLEQIEKDDLVSNENMVVHFCESYRRLCAFKGKPEQALPLLQRFDQKVPNENFALEAIRCLLAMKRLDEAETRARALVAVTPPLHSDSGVNSLFVRANLLLGAILELRNQPEQANEVWAQAMRQLRQAVPDGSPADHFLTSGGRSDFIHFLMLFGLSGELKDEDIPGLRNHFNVLYKRLLAPGNDPAAKTLVETVPSLFIERSLLNGLWSGARGQAFSRAFIRGETLYPESYSGPINLAFEKFFLVGATNREDPAPEEEAVYYRVSDDLDEALRRKDIGASQMMNLLSAWNGVTGQFGWAAVQTQFPEKLRTPMTLIMAQRYVKLGKKDEAAQMFRSVVGDPAAGATLVGLAKRALEGPAGN